MNNTEFAVIIPTYNNRTDLFTCLEGFSRQTFQSFFVIVCCDGSTDGTQAALQHAIANKVFSFEIFVTEHRDKRNHGRNATRNLALPILQTQQPRFIVFCDSDAQPDDNLLQNHYAELQQHDCISLGEFQYTNADSHHWANYLSSRGRTQFAHGDVLPYTYFNSGNCAHKAQYFIDLCGMDENFVSWGGGDVEYGIRLSRHAFSTPFINNRRAIVRSESEKTPEFALKQYEEFATSNLQLIITKHPLEKNLFALDFLTTRNFLFLLFRHFFSVIAHFRLCRFVVLPLLRCIPLRGIGKKISAFLCHVCVAEAVLRGFQKTRKLPNSL